MAAPADPDRILIIRPSALGDVCRTVPVLVSLRRAFPEARIEWVVQDTFVDAIAAHPALDEAIEFPRARFARWWRDPTVAAALARWFADLRRRRYDLVIDCQGLWRSGLMTMLTGARRRVGPSTARELGWIGYNARHTPPRTAHTVDQMLALIDAEGIEIVPDMRLHVDEAARAWWRRRAEELALADARYAVLAPTSRWPSKRWPADRWSQLPAPLRRRGFERVLLIGAPGEADQVEGIVDAAAGAGQDVIDLVGELTVARTMAVIEQAALVVANDSAPLHMAVGFDRPCVALFGPTDPARVGPYRRQDAVLRPDEPPQDDRAYKDRRLGDALMRRIDVEQVLDRIDEVFQATAKEPSA